MKACVGILFQDLFRDLFLGLFQDLFQVLRVRYDLHASHVLHEDLVLHDQMDHHMAELLHLVCDGDEAGHIHEVDQEVGVLPLVVAHDKHQEASRTGVSRLFLCYLSAGTCHI